ncbi:MAG: energy transducer TonB [Burkholderiales bacterium]|nr:energy transducer TonB [Burkholderiales bacterium]
MSTLTFEHEPGFAPSRLLSLAAIVLLHLTFFYALQHGLLSQAVQLLPKEVMLTLVQAPAQSMPAPPPPRPLEITKPLPPQPTITMPAELLTPPIPAVTEPAPISVATPIASVPSTSSNMETKAAATPTTQAAVAVNSQPRQINAVEYLRAPQPDYPPMSRRLGEEGRVILRVLVDTTGHAEKVDIHHSSGSHRLDEAAKMAILRAVFKPYLEDGKALPVIATATINFSLNS